MCAQLRSRGKLGWHLCALLGKDIPAPGGPGGGIAPQSHAPGVPGRTRKPAPSACTLFCLDSLQRPRLGGEAGRRRAALFPAIFCFLLTQGRHLAICKGILPRSNFWWPKYTFGTFRRVRESSVEGTGPCSRRPCWGRMRDGASLPDNNARPRAISVGGGRSGPSSESGLLLRMPCSSEGRAGGPREVGSEPRKTSLGEFWLRVPHYLSGLGKVFRETRVLERHQG